jgi:hypothetical protein
MSQPANSADRCAWVGDVPGEFSETDLIQFIAGEGFIIDRAIVRHSIGNRPGLFAVLYFRNDVDAARFRALSRITWPTGVVGEVRPIVMMWVLCDLKHVPKSRGEGGVWCGRGGGGGGPLLYPLSTSPLSHLPSPLSPLPLPNPASHPLPSPLRTQIHNIKTQRHTAVVFSICIFK